MPLHKTNRAQECSASGKAGVAYAHRKTVLWAALLLITAAGLYFFKSGPQETLSLPGASVLPVSMKPEALAIKVVGARPEASKPQTVPLEKTTKIALDMAKQRCITQREDFMAPRWSPDGLDILATKGKFKGLYLVSSDGTNIRQISDAPGIGYDARWSPDGRYVVAEQDDGFHYYDRSGEPVDTDKVPPQGKPPVYAKDGAIYLRSGNDHPGDDQVIMADEDQYFAPIASPDGSKVAFIGLESGIIIKDLETQETFFIGEGTDLSWTPDGEGIIYNFTQDDGERILAGDIYYASSDGSVTENLTSSPEVIERRPNMTVDGSKLAFEADGQIFTVRVMKR